MTKYPTPDGAFTLCVDDDGTIAFEHHAWQTHVEMLRDYRVEPRIASVDGLLDALAKRQLVMVISRFGDTGDEIRNVWLTHDAEAEKRCADVDEVLEMRYWDGAPYAGTFA